MAPSNGPVSIKSAIFVPLLVVLGIPILLLLLAGGAILVDGYFDRRDATAFAAVRMHAPEAEVVAALGAPDVERPCGKNLWWGGDNDYRGSNDGRCVREVRYEHFLSAWAIGYSRDGRVVSKYHYFSE